MGGSNAWMRTLVARYDPTDEVRASSLSRAGKDGRIDEETELLVFKVSRQLAAEPWA